MASQEHSRDSVRILSLDSGGPGTYSQALILEGIEEALKKRDGTGSNASNLIRDHFDLIGGVGFGGLIAIMLGRLGMTATQARDGLLKVAAAAFPLDSTGHITPQTRSQRLREAIEAIVVERGPVDAPLHDTPAGMPGCIVVVFAAMSNDDGQAHALRTYETTSSPLNPTIVQAACATISIPTFFVPVVIEKPMLRFSFVGGPKDCMNPALRLLDESRSLFEPERKISALISVGCGRPSFKHRPKPSDSSQRKQRYQSTSSGTFLDIISPGQMIRDSINKHKAKKAQSSKGPGSAVTVEPNAGWIAADGMANDCAATEKKVMARFAGSVGYMRLDIGKELTVLNLDDWNALGSILGHTKTYLGNLRLGSDVLRLMEPPKQTEKRSKSVPKAPPRVSPQFVPRDTPYRIMRHYLVDDRITSQKVMVVTGMGGCGKTQIVSYFLRENDRLYSHIVYVDASTEESIKTDLESWIQSIKGHEGDDWQGALNHLRHAPRDGEWILVLDNADDIKVELVPFLPACNRGAILITSRNRTRGELATTSHIELGVMTSEEAMGVLLLSAKRQVPLAPEEEVVAQSLLAELGCLPLAVSLTGSYCRQLSPSSLNPYTFRQYLEAFHLERSSLMDRQQLDPLDQYKQSVNTTIALSYGRLSDLEKEYLDLFATFDGADVSLEIFSEAAKRGFKDRKQWMERPAVHEETLEQLCSLFLADGKWKTVEIETAIANLTSNSLISTTSIVGTMHVHVHPLVQSWACDRRDQARSAQYTLMAAQVLTACNDDANPRLGRAMLPHIHLLGTTEKIAGLHVNCRMAFVSTLRERGHYNVAAEYCGAAYGELKGALGPEDLVTLEAGTVFAGIRHLEGHYEESRELHSRIWEKLKEKLGIDHPEALRSANSLAYAYGSLGRHQDALHLQLEVWEKLKQVLGVDHPGTLISANNLASTYWELGRYQDALRLHLEVWEKRKEMLGIDHPQALISASNLAHTYGDLGRHRDALNLQLEVWEKRKRILGVDHPDTLTSADSLAHTFRQLSRHQDALQLQLEVWEKRKEFSGAEHPKTLISAGNLALTYEYLGRPRDALNLQLEVWEKRKHILGVDHPETLISANNLAHTYGKLGRDQDALQLQSEVWKKRKEISGADHPLTLISAGHLTSTYGRLGRHQDALNLQLEVWEKQKQVLGVDHPETLISANNLAQTYGQLGRHQDALQLQLEVWEKRKEISGAEHPETLISASNLATTYGRLGHHQNALQLKLETWRKRKEILGVDHPSTLTSASNLAHTYGRLGRHQDAKRLHLELWEKQKAMLGVDHPDTLKSGFSLACTYCAQGEREQAFQLFREILTLQTMVIGKQHPDTQYMIDMASSHGFKINNGLA